MKMEPFKDPSHLLEVERLVYHAQRPGFRIAELQLSSPYHSSYSTCERTGESSAWLSFAADKRVLPFVRPKGRRTEFHTRLSHDCPHAD